MNVKLCPHVCASHVEPSIAQQLSHLPMCWWQRWTVVAGKLVADPGGHLLL